MGVIDDVMSKCTFDIAMDVEYEYLKPHLISIFPKLILQRAEGRDRANYEIMIEICDKVPKYGDRGFLKFVAALKQVNEYVFKKINNEYKVKTGNYLPGFEEVESNISEPAASSSEISQQPVTPPIIESSSPEINSAATMDMSQSGEMSASERVNSHLISTLPAENLESNAVSRYIQYVSYGPAVPCPSDMLHQQENQIVLDSSVQLNNYGNSSSESVLSNQNLSPSPGSELSHGADLCLGGATMLTKYDQKLSATPSSIYKMDSLPRGHCLIFNNERFEHLGPRAGSQEDYIALDKMFKFLGFEVHVHKNETAAEMTRLLTTFAKLSSLDQASSLSVVILSHGSQNDCIFGYDGVIDNNVPVGGTFIQKFDLQRIFNGRNCPAMDGKPKIFILQSCRGDDEDIRECIQNMDTSTDEQEHRNSPRDICLDSGDVNVTTSDGSPLENIDRAETADMCFLHSSSLGYKAYRSKINGSPFVQLLSQNVIKFAREKSFTGIVREVQNAFSTAKIGSKLMTMPEYSSSMGKQLYFNPPEL